MEGQLPRIEGAAVLAQGRSFGDWLREIHIHGLALLHGLPTDPDTIERVAALIGPVRATNFGLVFDVRSKPQADSNAYTSMPLPVHTDLATREYAPGLQFLHCVQNDAAGGDTFLADGFAVADRLRRQTPDLFETLCTVPFSFANKAKDTDFRWSAPMIELDRKGEIKEVRVSPWLRAPMIAPFDSVERAYRALRRFLQLADLPEHRITLRLRAGDLLAVDNRRVLHGRTGFDPASGGRWLRGCYVEREELHSRLRILDRRMRERLAGKGR